MRLTRTLLGAVVGGALAVTMATGAFAADVTLKLAGAQDLSDRSASLPAPDLELKQSVSGCVPSLGEEEVSFAFGIDVADAPVVDDDLDRPFQAGDGQPLAFLRYGL